MSDAVVTNQLQPEQEKPEPGLCSSSVAAGDDYPWITFCGNIGLRNVSAIARHLSPLQISRQLFFLGGVGVHLVVSFFPNSSQGAVGKISEEWKDHFKNTPVIENCVFEELQDNRKNLYHVRYQKDAFVIREIGSQEDASLDRIQGRNIYAGHFGSNYWAIEGGRVLKLFPDANKMIQEFQNPEVALIEAPRRKLLGALYFGFHLLDPTSIEWLDDSKFTGSSFRGEKFRGDILEVVGGLPTLFKWYSEADSELQFVTQCNYAKNHDMSYYPTNISIKAEMKGKTIPVIAYRILSLRTSRESMSETYFDPLRYFSRTSDSQTLVLSNGVYYGEMKDGSYMKVHTATPQDVLYGGRGSSKKVIILGFGVLSAIGLLFIWKHAKKQQ